MSSHVEGAGIASFFTDAAATARLLQSDVEVYDSATKVTQVFSGIFFSGLAIWLSFTNGTKLSFIQQAALEKRLTVCCFLGVYVGAFSAFFNFFQLTEVDNMMLEREVNFTLDFARPLEWIMTCPLMQLSLVLMGGSRIPEYRRMLMPGLSVAVLVSGTVSMLVTDIFVYVAYFVGCVIAGVMFWLNRKQIVEHSDGEECLLYGDSEFRKASLLLIITWVPFPTFYALSPEGFGIIDNILIIQVGWAFLNIVSKFTFIFYIQRIKDNYCSRLKVKREFYSAQNSVMPKGMDGTVTPPVVNAAQQKKAEKSQGELGAIVVETMNFLGMAQNSDRFLRLLSHCNINSLAELSQLSKEDCDKMQLPWDLVAAVQKRLRVWKLEMQDMAELALEQGELHYQDQIEDPMKMQAVSDRLQAVAAGRNGYSPSGTGTATPVITGQMIPLPGENPEMLAAGSEQALRLTRVEDMLQAMQQQNERFQVEVMRQFQESGSQGMTKSMEVALSQAMQSTLRAREQEVEGGIKQRVEELVSSAQSRLEQTAEVVASSLRTQAREFQATIDRSRESEGAMVKSMEDLLRKTTDEISKVLADAKHPLQELSKEIKTNVEGSNSATGRRQEDLERNIGRKIEDLCQKISDRADRTAEHLRGSLQADMTTMISRTDMVSEVVKESMHPLKESVGDLRRVCMTILDSTNGTQDATNQCYSRLLELRGAMDTSMDRILAQVTECQRQTASQESLAPAHQEQPFSQQGGSRASVSPVNNFSMSSGISNKRSSIAQDRLRNGLSVLGA